MLITNQQSLHHPTQKSSYQDIIMVIALAVLTQHPRQMHAPQHMLIGEAFNILNAPASNIGVIGEARREDNKGGSRIKHDNNKHWLLTGQEYRLDSGSSQGLRVDISPGRAP